MMGAKTRAATPKRVLEKRESVRVGAPAETVALASVRTYRPDDLGVAVRRLIELLGGLRGLVRPGSRVLLKPNLLSAKNPDRAITTHPEVVRAAAREVRRAGGIPLLGDSPAGVIRGIERLWRETGMKQLAREEGIELLSFERQGADPRRIGGRLIPISRVVHQVDAIINLPKMKTHSLTLYTGGIKNCFGLVPGFQKGEFHKALPGVTEFSRLLVDVWSLVRPSLTLMDGIIGMEGDGPSGGKPRVFGLLAASRDAVALDSVVADLMGFSIDEVAHTRFAASTGWGQGDLSRVEIRGEDPENLRVENLIFPRRRIYHRIPAPLVKLLGGLVWVRPYLEREQCTACSLCAESCPSGSLQLKDGVPWFDYHGCTSCMCCQEICAYGAIVPRLSRLARLWDGNR